MQIHDGSDDPSLRGAPREWLPPPLHPFLPRTAPGPLGAARVQLGALWDSGFPTSGTRARFTSSEIQQGCMQRCRRSPSSLGAQPLEQKEISEFHHLGAGEPF